MTSHIELFMQRIYMLFSRDRQILAGEVQDESYHVIKFQLIKLQWSEGNLHPFLINALHSQKESFNFPIGDRLIRTVGVLKYTQYIYPTERSFCSSVLFQFRVSLNVLPFIAGS
jgi:hypothetical protein